MADDDAGDLAEAIAALRADLAAAMDEGRGQGMQFGLGDVELTLQLVARKHGGARIGWAVLGVGGSYDAARTHSIKLVLQPMFETPAGILTRDFTIASQGSSQPVVGEQMLPEGDQPG